MGKGDGAVGWDKTAEVGAGEAWGEWEGWGSWVMSSSKGGVVG